MRHQRRRPLRLAVLALAFALLTAACGDGDDGGGDSGTSNAIKDGGRLTYAADQEPTGFNNNTSKDNGTSVVNVMDRVWPSVFHTNPKFEVVLDEDLMVSAEQTSASPQT